MLNYAHKGTTEEALKVTNMKDAKLNTNKFTNPFSIGTVVDNNDPQNSYRVKVRVDIIHKNISDDKLPWAARVGPTFMGFGNADIDHAVPEVGTKVLVVFLSNDPNSILYLGCLYKNNSVTPSGGNYLGTYGIYTQKGEFIGVDKINKTLKMVYEGKIDISKITQATININGPVNINASSATITCPTNTITGNVKIDGALEVSGTIDADKEITTKLAGGIKLSMHKHPGIFPGPSTSGTPIP